MIVISSASCSKVLSSILSAAEETPVALSSSVHGDWLLLPWAAANVLLKTHLCKRLGNGPWGPVGASLGGV